MNYKHAVQQFKIIYEDLFAEKPIDKPKVNLYWNCYVDSLQRDGLITEKQKFNWLDPIQSKNHKKEGN